MVVTARVGHLAAPALQQARPAPGQDTAKGAPHPSRLVARPPFSLRVVQLAPFRGLIEGAGKVGVATASAAQCVEVDVAPGLAAPGVIGDPSGVLLRAPLLPCNGTEVLPGVLHAARQDVPGLVPRPWLRATGRVAEADAAEQVPVVLGVPTAPRPLLTAAAAEAGDGGETAAGRAPPAPPATHRHVTVVHVVRQGPMGTLDQEAEADAAVAVGPVLHDARRVAEAVPSATPNLPSRVRVKLRVEGPPIPDDVVAAKGQPYTVLVGAVLVGLRAPDLAAPAAATVADLREAAPASGDAAVGPFAEEAAARAVLDAKVGVAVLQLPRPVVRQVVATRMAAAAADHPPILVPRRPGGIADRAVADLGPQAVPTARGVEGNVPRPTSHGPPSSA